MFRFEKTFAGLVAYLGDAVFARITTHLLANSTDAHGKAVEVLTPLPKADRLIDLPHDVKATDLHALLIELQGQE